MNKFYLLAATVAMGLTAAAQTDSVAVSATPTENTTLPYKKSIAVKFSPASLLFGKVQLGGEFNYKKKKSITFYVGIPLEQKLPSQLKDKMFESEQEKSTTDFKFKTMSAMIGYRMYLGKREMTGFYFEPYLKYVKNDIEGKYTADVDGMSTPFTLKSEYSGFGLGAQLGVQFMIAKRVVFDMYLLGPEANMSKHTAVLKDEGNIPWTPLNGREQDIENELKEKVKDIPIIGEKIDIKANAADKTVTSNYSGFLPGFRGGISLGIRF